MSDLKKVWQYTRELHQRRNGDAVPPDIASDPELAAAWRSLQLHWLATIPGYREEIKARLDKARRERIRKENMIDRSIAKSIARAERIDHDDLGREVEGCG